MAGLVAGSPPSQWELVPPVFKPHLEGVFTPLPGQVIGELPAVVGLEAELRPAIRTQGVVGNRPLEIDEGRPPGVVENAGGPPLIDFQGTVPYNRSEEHTSELQSRENLVCRLLLEKKK